MRIRTVRESDLKACLLLDATYETESAWQMEELHTEGEWSVHFREVRLPRKQELGHPLPPDKRSKAWERCDAFWVAVEGRNVIGYLVLTLGPGRGEARITDVVVGNDDRRSGVGTALLEQALEWCVRKSVEHLILECPLKAQPAIGFALKHRFVFCGYQDAYWPGQEVALFFQMRVR